MGEDAFIARLRAGRADPADVLGIGDDCCVWPGSGRECLSVDTVVAGVHFDPTTAPHDVGFKAAGAALSDLAAMGAQPIGAVVALNAPSDCDADAILGGVSACLDSHDCPLLGGDTVGSQELSVSITVWGRADDHGRLLLRSGGGPGDILAVTGPLGGSLASGRHLRPQPRLLEGAWLAGREAVHAMMDLSDGLAADVPRLAAASGCGALLLPDRIPVHEDVPQRGDRVQAACNDGEDFELLLAVEPGMWPSLQVDWPFAQPLLQVGWMLTEPGVFIENLYGRMEPLSWGGYQHPVRDRKEGVS